MFSFALYFAMQYLGISHSQIDCSHLVTEYLKAARLMKMDERLSAQGLYDRFSKCKCSSEVNLNEQGNLVFYGKDVNQISHVGITISKNVILDSGGNPGYVRIITMDHRKDLIAILRPFE